VKRCSLGDAAVQVATWRAAGETIALANGVFDLLHVGHVRYLVGAKALASRLVVAVNSDASTRAYKGPGRPVIPEAERAELLEALACTDLVLVFDEPDVRAVIRALRPDLHVKGTDYTPHSIPSGPRSRPTAVGSPSPETPRNTAPPAWSPSSEIDLHGETL
jgi:rfaE bifunctional protein nucleotidyltransferase chain/domain